MEQSHGVYWLTELIARISIKTIKVPLKCDIYHTPKWWLNTTKTLKKIRSLIRYIHLQSKRFKSLTSIEVPPLFKKQHRHYIHTTCYKICLWT